MEGQRKGLLSLWNQPVRSLWSQLSLDTEKQRRRMVCERWDNGEHVKLACDQYFIKWLPTEESPPSSPSSIARGQLTMKLIDVDF
jgi:hypothetical protein